MILDYVSSSKYFTLKVPRENAKLVSKIMVQDGFDFSAPASTPGVATLMTKEPYAAAAYGKYATPYARGQLHGILTAVE